MNLAAVLEKKHALNEKAFEDGRIAVRMYAENESFFREVAALIQRNQELEIEAGVREDAEFVRSMLRELKEFNLKLYLIEDELGSRVRLQPILLDEKILNYLEESTAPVHEEMLKMLASNEELYEETIRELVERGQVKEIRQPYGRKIMKLYEKTTMAG